MRSWDVMGFDEVVVVMVVVLLVDDWFDELMMMMMMISFHLIISWLFLKTILWVIVSRLVTKNFQSNQPNQNSWDLELIDLHHPEAEALKIWQIRSKIYQFKSTLNGFLEDHFKSSLITKLNNHSNVPPTLLNWSTVQFLSNQQSVSKVCSKFIHNWQKSAV